MVTAPCPAQRQFTNIPMFKTRVWRYKQQNHSCTSCGVGVGKDSTEEPAGHASLPSLSGKTGLLPFLAPLWTVRASPSIRNRVPPLLSPALVSTTTSAHGHCSCL